MEEEPLPRKKPVIIPKKPRRSLPRRGEAGGSPDRMRKPVGAPPPEVEALRGLLRTERSRVADLEGRLVVLQQNTVGLDEARQLTLKALHKGASLERMAYTVANLATNVACRRAAFELLSIQSRAKRLTSTVDVKRALAGSLNQRAWESHLQMLRQEQLTLIAENRMLSTKLDTLRKEYMTEPLAVEGIRRRAFVGTMMVALVLSTVLERTARRHLRFAIGRLADGYDRRGRRGRRPSFSLARAQGLLATLETLVRNRAILSKQAAFYKLLVWAARSRPQYRERPPPRPYVYPPLYHRATLGAVHPATTTLLPPSSRILLTPQEQHRYVAQPLTMPPSSPEHMTAVQRFVPLLIRAGNVPIPLARTPHAAAPPTRTDVRAISRSLKETLDRPPRPAPPPAGSSFQRPFGEPRLEDTLYQKLFEDLAADLSRVT